MNNYLKITDIVPGLTMYTAHPFFGININIVKSLPYVEKTVNSLFVKSKRVFEKDSYDNVTSLNDAGVYDISYNMRRSFFTLKEAEEYNAYMLTLESTHKHQEDHLKLCNQMNDMFGGFYEY